jgi:hypothetical protein
VAKKGSENEDLRQGKNFWIERLRKEICDEERIL